MINISIKIQPITYKLEKKINKYVNENKDFNKPNISSIKKYNIPKKILKSIVILHTYDKIIRNYSKVYNKRKELNNEYNNKIDILELVKKYNISPLTIFRIILRTRGFDKKKIKKIITNKLLNKYDLEQLDKAIKNDWFAGIDKEKQLKKSLEYENKIQKFLNKYKIKYDTQDNLIEKKSLLTPDFLIKSKLQINGNRVYWIDAKNFYGAYTKSNLYNLKKQAKKYNDAFGSGAFIFSNNFSNKLKIKNTQLLHV